MSSFSVFCMNSFSKDFRALSRKKSLLKRVIAIQNVMHVEVNSLSVSTSNSHKFSLQTLDLNVSFIQISKRKRTTKKTEFSKRNRKFKTQVEKKKNEIIKRRKTTQDMLITKDTQQNETQKNKERRWYDDKKKRHERMCDRAVRKNQTFLTSLSFILSNLKISSIDLSFLKSSSLDLFFFCSSLSSSSSHSIRSSSSFLLSSSFSSLSLSFNENSLFMNENSSTISSQNWNLIVFFYSSLDNLAREECNVCNEIEFAMMLKSWNSSMKCHRCRANKKKNLIMISLFEEINHMNSFLISSHLSRLSIAKKLLIARAHVFMNLRRVKDC
jgi:hypothetical protein